MTRDSGLGTRDSRLGSIRLTRHASRYRRLCANYANYASYADAARGSKKSQGAEWPIFAMPPIIDFMSTMNISLPDDLRAFVDEQVAARGYASTSEYLRELIRKQKDIEQLRQKLLEGASSPVVGVMDEAWFESLRERARRRPTE